MGETPFEPFFHGPPERRRGHRGSHRVTLERSFRCRASLRGPSAAPMARYQEFVRLHEAMSERPRVHVRRLWACGLGTALIVAVLMLGGVGLLRGVLGIEAPVFVAGGVSSATAAFTTAMCGAAAVVQATALLHVLMVVVERPARTFAWIGAMAVTLATLLPLSLRIPPDVALATAGLNLVGGAAAVGLLAAVANACFQWPDPPEHSRRFHDR
jgi:hypothetical protein